MEQSSTGISELLVAINQVLYGWRVRLATHLEEGGQLWLLAALAILGLTVLLLGRRNRRRRREAALVASVSEAFGRAASAPDLTALVFDTIFKTVPVPAAAFYLAESAEADLVRQGKLANPTLASGSGEDWDPPVRIRAGQDGADDGGGDSPVVLLPLTIEGHQRALVQVLAPTRYLGRRAAAACPLLRTLLTPLLGHLAAFLRARRLEEQALEASVASGSSQALLSMALGPEDLATILLDLAVRATASDGGFAVVENPSTPAGQSLTARGLEAGVLGALQAALAGRLLPFPGRAEVIELDPLDLGVAPVLVEAGFRSLAQTPIMVDGRLAGSLVVLARGGRFGEGQLQVFRLNAARLGLSLKNRAAQETMVKEYTGTLRAIVLTLESSRPYLRGHSDRVARLAVHLGETLGLSPEELQGLRLAGELHDVGMIGLGDDILSKAGRLTSGEYDLVKHHPAIGAALTAPIRLPVPIAPLVLHHHERWDGLGYPDGLKAGEIPVGARILALGEVFDAMVTARTYREALPFGEAARRLARLGGSQLDPRVVEAFAGTVNASWWSHLREAGVAAG